MQILQKLGLRKQPNITSPVIPSGLPIPELLDAVETTDYDDSGYSYDEEDVVERFQFLRPSCKYFHFSSNILFS